LKLEADKVRWAREAAGLTMGDAAAAGGLARRTVFRAEHSEDLRPNTARKLARTYGVELADLLPTTETEGEDSPKAPAPASHLEPSFNDVLKEERRTQEIEEITRHYSPCGDGLDKYCERWEKKIAADALDRDYVEEFFAVADNLGPSLMEALIGEALELAQALDTNDTDALWPKSVIKPAMDRYWALVEKLREEAAAQIGEPKPEPARDVIYLEEVRRRISGRQAS
jgi:transcriptional regulator with XRE-family HTH domain